MLKCQIHYRKHVYYSTYVTSYSLSRCILTWHVPAPQPASISLNKVSFCLKREESLISHYHKHTLRLVNNSHSDWAAVVNNSLVLGSVAMATQVVRESWRHPSRALWVLSVCSSPYLILMCVVQCNVILFHVLNGLRWLTVLECGCTVVQLRAVHIITKTIIITITITMCGR